MEIDPKLQKLLAEFFNKELEEITIDSSNENIEEWDSLEHIKLVLELEEQYNVKFPLDILPQLTSVKSIQSELNKLA
jgi:acyl carrier protein